MEQLIERDSELAAIADLIGRTASGNSGVLLVEGPAGVGKTRLLEAVADLAGDAPLAVLRARGGELERSFPFGIAAQLFGAAVAALQATQRATVVSGAAELALEIIVPGAVAQAPSAGSGEAFYARLHGLYWLCAGFAAQQPLMLVIDDAHWADEPSLQWLLFMARRVRDMPVTLLLSARPAGAGDWPGPLALLRGEPGVAVSTPRPLTEPASRILIGRMLGEAPDEAFSTACHHATGGNPFLLSELIASVSADGLAPSAAAAPQIRSLAPQGIVRSVVVRLGRMSREAAALAPCVALLGAEAELRHAAALADLDLAVAAAAADALVAAGLLDAGRPLRLVHPVVRTVLYSDLPDGERARLHGLAARMLADEGANPDAVAAHLLASEPANERWTVELLLSGAERALARGAPTTATSYLRRALAEPPPADQRARILRRLCVVESQLGDPAAAEHADQAMRLTSDLRQRAELALELSIAYLVAGRFEEAIAALEHAVQQTDKREQELRWRLQAQLISLAGIDSVHADVATRHLADVPHGLHGDTAGERAILAELALAALRAGDHVDVVVDLAMRAYAGGQLLAEQPPGSLLVQNAIWTLALTEQHQLAIPAYDELIEQSRRAGWPIVFALLSARRSQLHHLRGAIPDAIADAQAAIDAGSSFGPSRVAPTLYGTLARALLDAGDVHDAERALASGAVGDQIPALLPFFPLIDGRGRLRLAQGDLRAGIDDLLAGYQLLARFAMTNPAGTHCRSTAAVALAALDRHDEAHQLVAEELAAARKFGAPATVGTSLRAAGLIEAGSTGIEHLREAVAQLERSPARLQHARALADLGAALRRNGKRREAQHALRQALDLADRCGSKAVADQARAELVITGARPRRARISGVESLTASERRVAQLAAEGLTNRQIAQALFVSHPTVVTHLSHCYQKLNISSREQLADLLSTPPRAQHG
jgi:DNA-binding CsgD family transcriptional regulator